VLADILCPNTCPIFPFLSPFSCHRLPRLDLPDFLLSLDTFSVSLFDRSMSPCPPTLSRGYMASYSPILSRPWPCLVALRRLIVDSVPKGLIRFAVFVSAQSCCSSKPVLSYVGQVTVFALGPVGIKPPVGEETFPGRTGVKPFSFLDRRRPIQLGFSGEPCTLSDL
jgi:hypothetical protein